MKEEEEECCKLSAPLVKRDTVEKARGLHEALWESEFWQGVVLRE